MDLQILGKLISKLSVQKNRNNAPSIQQAPDVFLSLAQPFCSLENSSNKPPFLFLWYIYSI